MKVLIRFRENGLPVATQEIKGRPRAVYQLVRLASKWVTGPHREAHTIDCELRAAKLDTLVDILREIALEGDEYLEGDE